MVDLGALCSSEFLTAQVLERALSKNTGNSSPQTTLSISIYDLTVTRDSNWFLEHPHPLEPTISVFRHIWNLEPAPGVTFAGSGNWNPQSLPWEAPAGSPCRAAPTSFYPQHLLAVTKIKQG